MGQLYKNSTSGQSCVKFLNFYSERIPFCRYRHIETFGRGTIRRFDKNTSALKKLAARNYEDCLQVSFSTTESINRKILILALTPQCAVPVFEGLFINPEHDAYVQDILFVMAEWHANAKLRLHTDSTIQVLRDLTRTFGFMIRRFANTIASQYDTRELPREEAARVRRRAKKASQGKQAPAATTPSTTGPLRKAFNLLTYKLHALGDYVSHIIHFGTTDSYSTQTVSQVSIHTI